MNGPNSHLRNAHRAAQAARRLLWRSKVILLAAAICGLGMAAGFEFLAVPGALLAAIWIAMAVFILFFFRDPSPRCPTALDLVVAPAHGRVDVIEEQSTLEYMGGACRRVSIFLSVFNVHVQNAPVGGVVELAQYSPGKFTNAMSPSSARQNENLLFGFHAEGSAGERFGVRLIAGFIARRIVAWVKPGESVARGDRIGLIQCGSRCDLYLQSNYRILVRHGQKVRGGETPIAQRQAPPFKAEAEITQTPEFID